jgi:hypothetical protein
MRRSGVIGITIAAGAQTPAEGPFFTSNIVKTGAKGKKKRCPPRITQMYDFIDSLPGPLLRFTNKYLGASGHLRGRTGLSACIFFACGKKGYRSYPLRGRKPVAFAFQKWHPCHF